MAKRRQFYLVLRSQVRLRTPVCTKNDLQFDTSSLIVAFASPCGLPNLGIICCFCMGWLTSGQLASALSGQPYVSKRTVDCLGVVSVFGRRISLHHCKGLINRDLVSAHLIGN